MKTKITLIIAITAIVTLSFTFASTKKAITVSKTTNSSTTVDKDAPIGGFVMEDKL